MDRKWIALCALAVALLTAAAWYGGRRSRENPPVQAETAVSAAVENGQDDPVTRYRTEREQLRARHVAQLNDIIHGGHADDETVLLAQRQLLDLMRHTEQETTLEGILQSRGFRDALVTVSDDSANVLLRTDAVVQSEAAVILELVMRETGLSGGNVKIIPVK